MSRRIEQVQLALRERRSQVVLVAIWVLLTALCVIAGPFGTLEILDLPSRLAYWGLIVAVSIAGSSFPFFGRQISKPVKLLFWIGYVFALSGLILVLNNLVFGGWSSWAIYRYLVGIVGVTVIVVHGIIWVINFIRPATVQETEDPEIQFLRRLPLADRAPLVRIEAQDHYLNVVTTKGQSLILLRMSEAADALAKAQGLLVHRSHWVAFSGITAHRKEKGRDLLVMADGAEVPVSRARKAAAQEAGLF